MLRHQGSCAPPRGRLFRALWPGSWSWPVPCEAVAARKRRGPRWGRGSCSPRRCRSLAFFLGADGGGSSASLSLPDCFGRVDDDRVASVLLRRFLGNHRVPLPKPSRFMAFNRKPRFPLNPRAVCRATPSLAHFHRSTAASPGCLARWSVWSRNELVGVNLEDCGPSDAVPSSVSQQCIGGVDE